MSLTLYLLNFFNVFPTIFCSGEDLLCSFTLNLFILILLFSLFIKLINSILNKLKMFFSKTKSKSNTNNKVILMDRFLYYKNSRNERGYINLVIYIDFYLISIKPLLDLGKNNKLLMVAGPPLIFTKSTNNHLLLIKDMLYDISHLPHLFTVKEFIFNHLQNSTKNILVTGKFKNTTISELRDYEKRVKRGLVSSPPINDFINPPKLQLDPNMDPKLIFKMSIDTEKKNILRKQAQLGAVENKLFLIKLCNISDYFNNFDTLIKKDLNKPGVYIINIKPNTSKIEIINQDFYIGSSINIKKRLSYHISSTIPTFTKGIDKKEFICNFGTLYITTDYLLEFKKIHPNYILSKGEWLILNKLTDLHIKILEQSLLFYLRVPAGFLI